jgi:hypothetical protein
MLSGTPHHTHFVIPAKAGIPEFGATGKKLVDGTPRRTNVRIRGRRTMTIVGGVRRFSCPRFLLRSSLINPVI